MNNYTKTYLREVLKQTKNLPTDVSYSFLISQQARISETLKNENGSFCENCSCPLMTGYSRLRLLPPPRKSSHIKTIEKRNQNKRISRRQKLLLSLHQEGQNALVLECKVCKGEEVKKFTLPQRKVKKINSVITVDEEKLKKKKKKKKKKRNKDVNAGLLVPQELLKDPKLKKKNKDKSLVKNGDLESKVKLKIDVTTTANNTNTTSTTNTANNNNNNNNNKELKVVNKAKKNNEKKFVFSQAVSNKVTKAKKKPSFSEKHKATKIQNICMLEQMQRKKNILSLDSFLASLI